MGHNTSVSLDEHFVGSSINNGRYKNASEVIRAGLKLLEEEENKYAALKKAIREGISSGLTVDLNRKKHLALLKSKRK